jgi:hypothetical protein
MLTAQLERLADSIKIQTVRVDLQHLKTVVSRGTCYLPASAGIRFEPRQLPAFGAAAGIHVSGRPCFIPLSVGLPQPGNWHVHPYPLIPAVGRTVQIPLYLNIDNTDFVSERDRLLGLVKGKVTMTEAQAPRAHLMVQAETEHCLHFYIGVPPEQGLDQQDYGQWEKQDLGYLELVAGGCAGSRIA